MLSSGIAPGIPLEAGATMTISFSSTNCLAPSTSLVVSGPTTTLAPLDCTTVCTAFDAPSGVPSVSALAVWKRTLVPAASIWAFICSTARSTPRPKSTPNEPSEPVKGRATPTTYVCGPAVVAAGTPPCTAVQAPSSAASSASAATFSQCLCNIGAPSSLSLMGCESLLLVDCPWNRAPALGGDIALPSWRRPTERANYTTV